MIRRLVDWCVPSKALHWARPFTLAEATRILASRQFAFDDVARVFTTVGPSADTISKNLVRFTVLHNGNTADLASSLRAAFAARTKRKRHPRPLRAAGR